MDHHAIFLNGIPAAGKSSVARRLRNQRPTLRVVTGDDIVRQVPYDQRVRQAGLIWSRLLDAVDERLQSSSVLLDSALSAAQVMEAQNRFGGRAGFVILRIDEQVRARRQAERDRRGSPLGYPWRLEFHSMPGGDDLYDLVIDAGALSAAQCARRVLEFEAQHWPA